LKSTLANRSIGSWSGRVPCIAAPLAVFAGSPAGAHAFGARYDLPLPLELYLICAGAAVALSFVIMALAFDKRAVRARRFWLALSDLPSGRILSHPLLGMAMRCLSVGLFALVLWAGFAGNTDPVRNFAPAFVWIIWWIGFAYIAALVGNFWPLLNPWSNIFDVLGAALRLCRIKRPLSLSLPLPPRIGVWPAIILFMGFAWFELVGGSAKSPASLATAICLYSAVTWTGMALFGRDTWLARGEAFTLAFSVFGRFAPIGRRADDGPDISPDISTGEWGLRPYSSALITTVPCPLPMTIFIVVMLSTVTFDGFKETPFWSDQLQAIALSPFFHPLLRLIHNLGFDYFVVMDTLVLILFPIVFAIVYLAFCWMMRIAASGGPSVTETAGLFIYSLVPIAIAYHLAHYLSYLLTAGQLIIPLMSDPFGIGWNLFGTADYKTDIGIVGARFVWNSAAIAIVAGHVFAVGVSHFVALKVYEPVRRALRSQYPLLLLMVGYTMLSLWILSQPIVGAPSLINLSLRSDTISLAPFEFRELCVSLKKDQDMTVAFHTGEPIEFDIHYHDGLTVRFPVKLTGVTSHTGRFIADNDRAYCMMWFNRDLTETTLQYRVDGPPEPERDPAQN
jgi:hypothetical protein